MSMPDTVDPSVARIEDRRLLVGEGRFTADLRLPNTGHAVVLRSPHAHATIRGIDIDAARAAPGVLGIFTGADLTADGIPAMPGGVDVPRPDGTKAPKTMRPVIARDRVRFVGEAVAIIVAETEAAASEAAELVAVDYAELPSVASARQALEPGAPELWSEAPDNIAYLWHKGDADAVTAIFKDAAHITRFTSEISRVSANPLEPRVAVGTVEDGRLVLYTSHQGPYALRNQLAALFGVASDRVLVVAGDVGGSFGMKAGVHPEEIMVLFAARRLGRPVRWVSDRTEGFLTDDHARDVAVRAELALAPDGSFLALRFRYDINIGAYLSSRSLAPVNNIGGVAGVYRIPRILADAYGVFTNTAVTSPYRGAGRPEATYTIERLIDIAACELGIDPFELRRRNLIPAAEMPFKTDLTFTYDCGDFAANMNAAAQLADLKGFPGRRAESASRGRLRGLGISNPIEVAGGPFGKPAKDASSLRVSPDGSVTLLSGAMSTGQGIETAFSQLVAERLGVDLAQIAYAQGSTDQLASGRGSGGSSALCVGGAAVSLALDKVIEKGRFLAAELLEAAAADIEFAGGRFTVAGTDRSASLAEVARFAEEPARLPPGLEPGLTGAGEFQPPAVTFPNGCHICEVEIDQETGTVALVRYSLVEDVGRVFNPMLVRGQVHGGVAQGVGQALGEQIIYDRQSGQLITASFTDYQMPRAADLCPIAIETREVPTAVNPLGAKGVGEAGTVGALAATMNAVCNALSELGIGHIDMPATPSRVWASIQASAAR
jgi:aerobic carbon-monoxide dehydrogenase large subunit